MKNQEIKKIKMFSLLQFNPTGEFFKVTGYNEFKVQSGTESHVCGIECDQSGSYNGSSMESEYDLSKCSFIK